MHTIEAMVKVEVETIKTYRVHFTHEEVIEIVKQYLKENEMGWPQYIEPEISSSGDCHEGCSLYIAFIGKDVS